MNCTFCGVQLSYQILICCDPYSHLCIDCALENPQFNPKLQCNNCGRQLGNKLFYKTQTLAEDIQKQIMRSYGRNFPQTNYGNMRHPEQFYPQYQRGFNFTPVGYGMYNQPPNILSIRKPLNVRPQRVHRNVSPVQNNFGNGYGYGNNFSYSYQGAHQYRNRNQFNDRNINNKNLKFNPEIKSPRNTQKQQHNEMEVENSQGFHENQFQNNQLSSNNKRNQFQRQRLYQQNYPQRSNTHRNSSFIQLKHSYQHHQNYINEISIQKQTEEKIRRGGLNYGMDHLIEGNDQPKQPSPTFNYEKCKGDTHYVYKQGQSYSFGKQENRRRHNEEQDKRKIEIKNESGRVIRSLSSINLNRNN